MISREVLQPISETSLVDVVEGDGEEHPYKSRRIMPMPSKKMDVLTGTQRKFWDGMSEILNSIEMQSALLHKFQPFLDERLGPDLGGATFKTNTLFMQDQGNYQIGPHTDHPENVVVLLIYLPRTDEHPEWGTSLYLSQDKNFRCDGGPHYNFTGFDRIYTFKFQVNSAVCFLKTSFSFHGVEKNPSADIDRNLIQVCIAHQPISKPM